MLQARDDTGELSFAYGDSYLDRKGAVSIYGPELPLQRATWFGPTQNLGLPGSLRDAAPDAWGRRVIINRRAGRTTRNTDTGDLPESVYLMESESNRLGAVDFQRSATEYVPREDVATLDQLQEAAQIVERGEELPEYLSSALLNGTAMGGARPKALLRDGDTQYLAKFSTSDDSLDIVGAEAASIFMARASGISATNARIARSLGRKVLLMERFDRTPEGGRRMVVSALTMVRAPESYMPESTYPEILDVLRAHGGTGSDNGKQMFERIAYNIMISNSDDHLRNHAAFWDGHELELTPAYDLSPVSRSGDTSRQMLAYSRDGQRDSNLALLIEAAEVYDLSREEATESVHSMIHSMRSTWDEAADFAELTEVDKKTLWGHQFLHPATMYNLEPL